MRLSLETPTHVILPPLAISDEYIRCVFYSMTRAGQLANLYLEVVNVLFILGNIYSRVRFIHSFYVANKYFVLFRVCRVHSVCVLSVTR